jgi:hypothetical protein
VKISAVIAATTIVRFRNIRHSPRPQPNNLISGVNGSGSHWMRGKFRATITRLPFGGIAG